MCVCVREECVYCIGAGDYRSFSKLSGARVVLHVLRGLQGLPFLVVSVWAQSRCDNRFEAYVGNQYAERKVGFDMRFGW